MRPTLFELEFNGMIVSLNSYKVFLTLAFISVFLISWLRFLRIGISTKRSLVFLTVCSVSTLVGSRALYIITANKSWHDFAALGFRDFSMSGGLLAASFSALIMCKFMKLSIWKLGDALVPGISAGIILSRVGCLFNGCCFGKPTDLPWSIRYPIMSYNHLDQLQKGLLPFFTASPLPVHPTQIYEIIAVFFGAIVSYFIWKKTFTDGLAFVSASFLYISFRLVNNLFRVTPIGEKENFSLYNTIFVVILILCTIAYFRLIHNTKKQNQTNNLQM